VEQVAAQGRTPIHTTWDQPEFIPVKCNIHPWMHGYFAVLATSHSAVSDEGGAFTLADSPQARVARADVHLVACAPSCIRRAAALAKQSAEALPPSPWAGLRSSSGPPATKRLHENSRFISFAPFRVWLQWPARR